MITFKDEFLKLGVKIMGTIKYIISACICVAILLLVACNDENGDKLSSAYIIEFDNIEVKGSYEGYGNVSNVLAIIAGSKAEYFPEHSLDKFPAWVQTGVIAEASFENNSFELHLPSVLSTNLLVSVSEEKMQDVLISDPSAKWIFLDFVIEFTNINYFFLLSLDNSHLQDNDIANKIIQYVYVDRPVILSGVATWTETIQATPVDYYISEVHNIYNNLVLTTGWNKMCIERSVNISEYPRKIYNKYSMRNTDDCKWNVFIYSR